MDEQEMDDRGAREMDEGVDGKGIGSRSTFDSQY